MHIKRERMLTGIPAAAVGAVFFLTVGPPLLTLEKIRCQPGRKKAFHSGAWGARSGESRFRLRTNSLGRRFAQFCQRLLDHTDLVLQMLPENLSKPGTVASLKCANDLLVIINCLTPAFR